MYGLGFGRPSSRMCGWLSERRRWGPILHGQSQMDSSTIVTGSTFGEGHSRDSSSASVTTIWRRGILACSRP
ncbi:hypothetical protein NXF25_019169 [Crotalus adamanteus]|uniref:Uncharacterized protein n=1 Tax=Crotalus adamanteus TaxID=8729 RepID=A0AAW1B1W0_CROAD